ncbi:hypothetical protein AAMO2058_000689600 [Amorphochlora amoebiformis]
MYVPYLRNPLFPPVYENTYGKKICPLASMPFQYAELSTPWSISAYKASSGAPMDHPQTPRGKNMLPNTHYMLDVGVDGFDVSRARNLATRTAYSPSPDLPTHLSMPSSITPWGIIIGRLSLDLDLRRRLSQTIGATRTTGGLDYTVLCRSYTDGASTHFWCTSSRPCSLATNTSAMYSSTALAVRAPYRGYPWFLLKALVATYASAPMNDIRRKCLHDRASRVLALYTRYSLDITIALDLCSNTSNTIGS